MGTICSLVFFTYSPVKIRNLRERVLALLYLAREWISIFSTDYKQRPGNNLKRKKRLRLDSDNQADA